MGVNKKEHIQCSDEMMSDQDMLFLYKSFGSIINVGVKPTDIAKIVKKQKKEEHI